LSGGIDVLFKCFTNKDEIFKDLLLLVQVEPKSESLLGEESLEEPLFAVAV
jgi:hypothetical protein